MTRFDLPNNRKRDNHRLKNIVCKGQVGGSGPQRPWRSGKVEVRK